MFYNIQSHEAYVDRGCVTEKNLKKSGWPEGNSLMKPLNQACRLAIGKKTQGEKNSKLKKKTQTQAKNSIFWHILENLHFLDIFS